MAVLDQEKNSSKIDIGQRFRTKKISIKAPLVLVHESQVPELDDSNLQRSVIQVESGVDKDEEEEHHLREAINANLASISGAKVERKYIPTPNAIENSVDYDLYYAKGYKQPVTWIRFSSTVEECCGCNYCADEEDEEWVNKFEVENVKLDLETLEILFSAFEALKFSHYLLDAQDFEILDLPSKSLKSLCKYVYPYYKEKKIRNEDKPLMPTLRFEENEKDDKDPYTCFRRREIRQVRKTRRSDTKGTEKLMNLRVDMKMARNILDMVVKRESMQLDSLLLERHIFEHRIVVKDLKRKLELKDSDDDLFTTVKKKRQLDLAHRHSTAASTPTNILSKAGHQRDVEKLTSLSDFREKLRREQLNTIQETLVSKENKDFVDLTYFHGSVFEPDRQMIYFKFVLSQDKQATDTCFRRRIGRNGRVFLDRIDARNFHDSFSKIDSVDEFSAGAIKTRAILWANSTERPTGNESNTN